MWVHPDKLFARLSLQIAIDIRNNVTSLGIKDIDGQLGPYPFESLKTWYSLTNHITETLMKRFVVNNCVSL